MNIFGRADIRRKLIAPVVLLMLSALFACSAGDEASQAGKADILLFNGDGVSRNDVAAFERILRANHFNYATVDSRQLNEMDALQLRSHRLLIVPGGNFVEMGKGLTAVATANVRDAVHGGLNYLGVCGGAFIAGNSPYNGINLTDGVRFRFYSLETQNIRKAVVAIAVPGAPTTVDHYWEDGPELTGWGDAVAKYPDGTPAVAQGAAGSGWVILSGVHPEAPENWRDGMTFTTSADASNAYAVKLIDAALNRTSLAHY
ncbi:MAG TPA: BPL-N domain-containing protein [Povalibacter sp.]|nr:BPL-N domain-containing protein [Povalibacter sp.]